MKAKNIIISKCLLGIPCRFDGKAIKQKNSDIFFNLHNKGSIPVCSEEMGGLPTPRPPAEIQGGDGIDVISGNINVETKNKEDVTLAYIKGAKETLQQARDNKIELAILKSRSPACGCGQIYDGTFSGKLKKGDGVTTALLKSAGYKVITDEDNSLELFIQDQLE